MSKLLVSSLALLFSATSAMAAPGEPNAPHIGKAISDGKLYIVDPTKPVEIIYQGGYRDHKNALSVFTVDADYEVPAARETRYFNSERVAVDPERRLPQGTYSAYFSANTELVFVLTNITDPGAYTSTNSYVWSDDYRSHAYVSYDKSKNLAFVAFEDLGAYNGSDWDYNDYFFLVTNVSSTPIPKSPLPSVPEPETYVMLLAGLGIVGSVARRRRK